MLYTNNQGPKTWALYLTKYFETKLNASIFDRIIAAFKINGKQIESLRTTHKKTYNDLIRCTQLPLNTEFFFLDDVYHSEMCHNKVYYINIKPYVHKLPIPELVKRFSESSIGKNYFKMFPKESPKQIIQKISENEKQQHSLFIQNKTSQEMVIDKILSKKILHHLQQFFHIGNETIQKKTLKKKITKPFKSVQTKRNRFTI